VLLAASVWLQAGRPGGQGSVWAGAGGGEPNTVSGVGKFEGGGKWLAASARSVGEGKRPWADRPAKAAIITVSEMVDEGLYESIKRRTEAALSEGATHLIYQMDTFGGRVDSAIDIYTYLLQDVGHRARTIAYIPTKAISAGALIAVSCQDIIMRKAAKLGDCAPIQLGGKLEGVEREKIESTLRSYFTDAAEINGYPPALCRAMVSAQLAVYQVKNRRTGGFEYLEKEDLGGEPNAYVGGRKLIDKEGELLTVTADQALEYGLARAVAGGLERQAVEEALVFLEQRDGVRFPRPAGVWETNWSEQLVRWIASPAVSGILLAVALLGIYIELNTPGVILPGAAAALALAILFGSKFLIGLANWWEIVVFVIGLGLLGLEILVLPGFGVAGILGIVLMLLGLGAMMVPNKPGELPIPVGEYEWQGFEQSLIWSMVGLLLFVVAAMLAGTYMSRLPFLKRLVLAGPGGGGGGGAGRGYGGRGEGAAGSGAAAIESPAVKAGEGGVSLTPLRPAGNARFGNKRLPVVTRGEMVEPGREIVVIRIEGNNVIVKEGGGPGASV